MLNVGSVVTILARNQLIHGGEREREREISDLMVFWVCFVMRGEGGRERERSLTT
jgi:hypothetical protein